MLSKAFEMSKNIERTSPDRKRDWFVFRSFSLSRKEEISLKINLSTIFQNTGRSTQGSNYSDIVSHLFYTLVLRLLFPCAWVDERIQRISKYYR